MRFFGTAITAGFLFSPEPAFAAVSMAILLGLDARVMLERDPDDPVPGALMRGPLRMATCLRITASLVFMVSASVGNPWVSLSILAVSEFAARSLFFRAVNEPRMPGFA